MNKTKVKSQFELDLEQSFRRMWLIALGVGLVALLLIALFETQTPLVLLVALIAGALLGLFLEIRRDVLKRQRARLLEVALERQKLEAQLFGILYRDWDSREEQFRGSEINDAASMKKQPAYAGS